jgi:hypothetical protein
VRNISFRGVTINGEAQAHFVLSPASATCTKLRGSATLSCKLVGDTSSASLAGASRRRRRKKGR